MADKFQIFQWLVRKALLYQPMQIECTTIANVIQANSLTCSHGESHGATGEKHSFSCVSHMRAHKIGMRNAVTVGKDDIGGGAILHCFVQYFAFPITIVGVP